MFAITLEDYFLYHIWSHLRPFLSNQHRDVQLGFTRAERPHPFVEQLMDLICDFIMFTNLGRVGKDIVKIQVHFPLFYHGVQGD